MLQVIRAGGLVVVILAHLCEGFIGCLGCVGARAKRRSLPGFMECCSRCHALPTGVPP
jgi:hypothetical protein